MGELWVACEGSVYSVDPPTLTLKVREIERERERERERESTCFCCLKLHRSIEPPENVIVGEVGSGERDGLSVYPYKVVMGRYSNFYGVFVFICSWSALCPLGSG